MITNYVDWKTLYQKPSSFHIYFTERKRGKSDTKAWKLLEDIVSDHKIKHAWIRRRWKDSSDCTRPYFEDEVYKFCEEKGINYSNFKILERGIYYQEQRRIHFYDLFSYQKARGAIAKGTIFSEIVYEEAIPIDQEFLFVKGNSEQFMFHDLFDSLKRKNNQLKITFLANPYLFSAWFLDIFPNLFKMKKEAEEKKLKNDNSGVLETIKDEEEVEWLLYLNLLEGEKDPQSSTLKEKLNPSRRNWDDFMIDEPKKYQILYAVQDYYFCEIGEREVFKKYCFMHFIKNRKETDNFLVNFCFNLEEKAKSKLRNCVIRNKSELLTRWVNMLKEGMLYFRDFRSRDWFLELIKHNE